MGGQDIKMPSLLDIALGRVGKNSNPVHTALVHFPLTFVFTASLLDITTFLSNGHTETFTKIISPDHIPVLNSISYFSTVAALLTSIPTLITGVAEGYNLIFHSGIDSDNLKRGKLHPTVKMAILHAWLNYFSVAGAVYNWLTRRSVQGYSSRGRNVIVSGLILGTMGYAGYLGGTLVYARGAGVQRMGHGLELKQKTERATKREGKDVKGAND